jgi:hypothetical protein
MSGNGHRKSSVIGALVFLGLLLLAHAAPAVTAPDTVDRLARDVTRLESLRAVKDVQRSYAQYAQFGLWPEMAALFAKDGRIIRGDRVIAGAGAISAWLKANGGPAGSVPGALNTEMIDDPLVNLSVDGQSAKGRWRGLALRGDGQGRAWMEGGLYENDYVLEDGQWKIATLHYHPQYEGSYATGWSNVDQQDLPIIPFHFTIDETGIPIPPAEGAAPESGATPATLAGRIAALNAENDVRNLQDAYGYYVDLRMWDDVVDLFAEDGVIEIGGTLYKGKAGVRRAMERMGPAGLTHGVLNDHPLFDVMVKVMPGGNEAFSRGTELGMIGEADEGTARWEVNVFRNRFVRENGLWKIREMRITPVMRADYRTGWGNGAARPPMPAMLGPNPATGQAVATGDLTITAAEPLTGAIAPGPAPEVKDLADLRRRYRRAVAYDGTVNVSAAYGYYLDDFQWPGMSGIIAVKGNKQSPFAGYYFGRERIAGAATAMYGKTPDAATVMRKRLATHWRTQPVVTISHDGRSTLQRTRLFHPNTGKYDAAEGGPNKRGTIQTGMYPNDQFVLEDGIWRMWSVTIDEPYMVMPDWQGGWSAAKAPPPGGGMRPSPLLKRYPPDLLLTALGEREEGFAGGTGEKIDWPGILPMWFHYRNLVSGRAPERYWPDCVPCEVRPEVSMTRNGYQMPPTGPAIDGIELRK